MGHFADWLENARPEHHLSEESLESILATVVKVLDAVRVQADIVIADVDAFVKKVSTARPFLTLWSNAKLSNWVQALTVDMSKPRDKNRGTVRDLLLNPQAPHVGALREYNVLNEASLYVEYMASLASVGMN